MIGFSDWRRREVQDTILRQRSRRKAVRVEQIRRLMIKVGQFTPAHPSPVCGCINLFLLVLLILPTEATHVRSANTADIEAESSSRSSVVKLKRRTHRIDL